MLLAPTGFVQVKPNTRFEADHDTGQENASERFNTAE